MEPAVDIIAQTVAIKKSYEAGDLTEDEYHELIQDLADIEKIEERVGHELKKIEREKLVSDILKIADFGVKLVG